MFVFFRSLEFSREENILVLMKLAPNGMDLNMGRFFFNWQNRYMQTYATGNEITNFKVKESKIKYLLSI